MRPLFYLIPFDFHADKRRQQRRRPRIVDFNLGETLLFLLMAVVALGLFVAFIVFPALTVLGQSAP